MQTTDTSVVCSRGTHLILHHLFDYVLAHSAVDSVRVGISASTVASSANILRHAMECNFICETETLQMHDLHCVLCQINIVVEVANEHFEVLAMIEEETQLNDDDDVPPGPALRDAKGEEHIKSVKEGKGGFFPHTVAEAGALVRVQDAEASWASDKTTILNHIVEGADSTSEPPTEHANYDKMNRTVQGLFRGAAMFSHSMSGRIQKLRDLFSEGNTEGIDYKSTEGCTPAYVSAQEGHTECLQLLADRKADLNQPTNDGATPAFISAQEDHTECLRLLADCKADLNQATSWGETLLSTATSSGHSAIVRILQAAGAPDLNQAERNAAAVQRCGQNPVGTVIPFGSEWCTHGPRDALATSGKVCYEVKLLTSAGPGPQFGWASPAFSCGGGNGAGDDAASWAVDGVRGKMWHDGDNDWGIPPSWVAGDIISIAADVDKGDIWCAHNGEWVLAFHNANLAAGVFPVVTTSQALVSINLGEQPLQHPPPSDGFVNVSSQSESPTLVLMTEDGASSCSDAS